MSTLIDTSVIVRYLTNDPPDRADACRRVIEDVPSVMLSEIALIESAWVLERVYRAPRNRLVDELIDLVRRDNIELAVLTKDLAIDGLLMCRPSRRVSFADAFLWATARLRGDLVCTLSRRFPTAGIEVRKPH